MGSYIIEFLFLILLIECNYPITKEEVQAFESGRKVSLVLPQIWSCSPSASPASTDLQYSWKASFQRQFFHCPFESSNDIEEQRSLEMCVLLEIEQAQRTQMWHLRPCLATLSGHHLSSSRWTSTWSFQIPRVCTLGSSRRLGWRRWRSNSESTSISEISQVAKAKKRSHAKEQKEQDQGECINRARSTLDLQQWGWRHFAAAQCWIDRQVPGVGHGAQKAWQHIDIQCSADHC